MSSFEAKKDYTTDLQALVPQSASLANEGRLDEAVVQLLALEKKCRLNNDSATLKEVCVHMIRLCREKTDWIKLNSTLAVIEKRNSLSKGVVSAVVAESMTYFDATPDTDTKIELIKALKSICDGKIYVEGESAQLHFMLSKIYEDRGDIDAACDIIQDVHVETYGSLSKIQKAEYILEQIRLNLIKKDYIRSLIHSRKMNTKTLDEEGFEAVKIRFYTMMVEYHSVEKDSWEVCQAYYKIATIKQPSSAMEVESDIGSSSSETTAALSEEVRLASLEGCIIFLLLSKFDNHQSDMMHRVQLQLSTLFKDTALAAAYSNALSLFTSDEIIVTPFNGQDVIEAHPCLGKIGTLVPDIVQYFVNQLMDRIIQHNLRVVSKYYKRIRMQRLSELMVLDSVTLESYLSDMSGAGDIFLKIDRPAGIVSFKQKAKPEEILSDWSSDIGKMLNLMEGTCHLINRESMVYKV